MYISNLKSGSVSGQTAGTQSGQTSLVGQLTQRVVLIHELGQLGRSEELFYSSCYRFDIDQRLRRNTGNILCGHTLANHTLQSGQTDTVLILQKLTHGTDTTVAQVIDIIVIAQTILQMHVIVNGGQNILLGNVFRDQIVNIALDSVFDILDICIFGKNSGQHRIINQLCHSQFFLFFLGQIHVSRKIYHHTGKHFDIAGLSLDPYIRNCRILDLISQLFCHLGARLSQDLPCGDIHYILGKNVSGDTVPEHQLLVEFISTNLCQIITARVKEHGHDQTLGALYSQRLAGTDLFVQFQKALLITGGHILRKTCHDLRLLTEQIDDFLIGTIAQCTDQYSDRHLTGTVYTNIKNVIGVSFVFQPCTTVRDYGTGKQSLSQFIMRNTVINTRGTNQLADDYTLSTVDHEGTGCCHQRQVSHKDLMLIDLIVFMVI